MAILASPNPPSLIAIDEPETGLHPRMMGIVAECAMDAATRTQVVLMTHSPEFLDAFRDTQPTVTVADLVDGATQLRTPSAEDLAYWLEEYTLGDIYRTGQLESMG
jgi:predicted ATPase